LTQRVRAEGATDVGRVRKHNEDAFALLPEAGLFVVADGMGGLAGGETAAQVVTQVLPALLEKRLADRQDVEAVVRECIADLSQATRKWAANLPGISGMGSTVVLALVQGENACIAHMGDSRAYLYRQGGLILLTDDHSVVGILLRSGEITAEQAVNHPARSKLSRYVGMESVVHPDVKMVRMQAGDRLLLCSDGLTGMVVDAGIAQILASQPDPRAAARRLVGSANEAGGKDNVTAVVIDWN
jgi:serine/threonine protein phosphatase PrpC